MLLVEDRESSDARVKVVFEMNGLGSLHFAGEVTKAQRCERSMARQTVN